MEKLTYDCQILIQQNRLLEAQSLAFQHFGNLTQAKEFIASLQNTDNQNHSDNTATENHESNRELFEEVVRLVEKNMKLNAIKVFKDATGIGLKDAKDLIDLIEANLNSKDVLAGILSQHFNVSTNANPVVTQTISPQSNTFGTSVPLKTLLDLLQKKQKIEAVKLVKDTDGLGLKESKDIVDAIQAHYNL